MLKQRTYITWLVRFGLLGAIAALLAAAPMPTPAPNTTSNHKEPYKVSQCDDPALSPSERAGCKIWFYATAGNGRFHAYVLPQRMPVLASVTAANPSSNPERSCLRPESKKTVWSGAAHWGCLPGQARPYP